MEDDFALCFALKYPHVNSRAKLVALSRAHAQKSVSTYVLFNFNYVRCCRSFQETMHSKIISPTCVKKTTNFPRARRENDVWLNQLQILLITRAAEKLAGARGKVFFRGPYLKILSGNNFLGQNFSGQVRCNCFPATFYLNFSRQISVFS